MLKTMDLRSILVAIAERVVGHKETYEGQCDHHSAGIIHELAVLTARLDCYESTKFNRGVIQVMPTPTLSSFVAGLTYGLAEFLADAANAATGNALAGASFAVDDPSFGVINAPNFTDAQGHVWAGPSFTAGATVGATGKITATSPEEPDADTPGNNVLAELDGTVIAAPVPADENGVIVVTSPTA